MQHNDSRITKALSISRSGVLFVSGYATSLRVARRQLVVRTGSGGDIVEGCFSKVTRPRLRRVVISGTAGQLTLPVLDWLRGVGAALVVIDRNGEVLASSIEGPKDARLLRAQALAPYNPTGVLIAQLLIGEKLRGQIQVLRFLEGCDDAIDRIEHEIRLVQSTTKVQAIRAAEARAASLYWGCWSGRVEISFARRELASVPPHWRAFDQRHSLLSGTPRKATDPINALINYAGALAQVECEIACRSLGLSPSLAIVHGDVVRRSGFALDLQEVVRPEYESALLRMLRSQTFSLRDFGEDSEGRCTLSRRITRYLAESVSEWSRGLAPAAERVAQLLADSSPLSVGTSTRLTQANRRRAPERSTRPRSKRQSQAAPNACAICGVILHDINRSYCDDCLPAKKSELVSDMLERSNEQRRGRPRSDEAKARQSETMRIRNREIAEWHLSDEPRLEPAFFRQEVLPKIRAVSVRTLVARTGLSSLYCSQIRRGLRIPHQRHWKAFLKGADGPG